MALLFAPSASCSRPAGADASFAAVSFGAMQFAVGSDEREGADCAGGDHDDAHAAHAVPGHAPAEGRQRGGRAEGALAEQADRSPGGLGESMRSRRRGGWPRMKPGAGGGHALGADPTDMFEALTDESGWSPAELTEHLATLLRRTFVAH